MSDHGYSPAPRNVYAYILWRRRQLRSGHLAPVTGPYRAFRRDGTPTDAVYRVKAGDPLPPTNRKGMYYALVRRTCDR